MFYRLITTIYALATTLPQSVVTHLHLTKVSIGKIESKSTRASYQGLAKYEKNEMWVGRYRCYDFLPNQKS